MDIGTTTIYMPVSLEGTQPVTNIVTQHDHGLRNRFEFSFNNQSA